MLRRFSTHLTRAAIRGGKLVGHAAVFGQVAAVADGWEGLDRTAFDVVLGDPLTDVRALWNHDPSLLLGRQGAGTLEVSVDDDGLPFEISLPDTSYAHDLRVLVQRGDLDGASFGFIPGESRVDRSTGRAVRWHTSVAGLVDVSPVTFPAYAGAGTELRALPLQLAAHPRPSGIAGQTALLRHQVRTEGRR